MRKRITFGQLEQFLVNVGFISVPTTGNHKVYEHEAAGAIILLPIRDPHEEVDAARVASIRNIVVGKGVLDGKEPDELFDDLLTKA